MAELDQLTERFGGNERKRTAGEFQRVDIVAHGFEEVLEVAAAHRTVVRPPNLRHATEARLSLPPVLAEKAKWIAITGVVLRHRTSMRETVADAEMDAQK